MALTPAAVAIGFENTLVTLAVALFSIVRSRTQATEFSFLV
jgi:hypothetical protein